MGNDELFEIAVVVRHRWQAPVPVGIVHAEEVINLSLHVVFLFVFGLAETIGFTTKTFNELLCAFHY